MKENIDSTCHNRCAYCNVEERSAETTFGVEGACDCLGVMHRIQRHAKSIEIPPWDALFFVTMSLQSFPLARHLCCQ